LEDERAFRRCAFGSEREQTIIRISETKARAELFRIAGAGVAMHYFQADHELEKLK